MRWAQNQFLSFLCEVYYFIAVVLILFLSATQILVLIMNTSLPKIKVKPKENAKIREGLLKTWKNTKSHRLSSIKNDL